MNKYVFKYLFSFFQSILSIYRRPDTDELGWGVVMFPTVIEFPGIMKPYTASTSAKRQGKIDDENIQEQAMDYSDDMGVQEWLRVETHVEPLVEPLGKDEA